MADYHIHQRQDKDLVEVIRNKDGQVEYSASSFEEATTRLPKGSSYSKDSCFDTSLDEALKGLSSAPKKGDILTLGELERSIGYLRNSPFTNKQEPRPRYTQEELKQACKDIHEALKKRITLVKESGEEQEGIFTSAGLGIYFVSYSPSGDIVRKLYSQEELEKQRSPVIFKEARLTTRGDAPLTALDKLYYRYKLHRAKVRPHNKRDS